MKVEELRIGNLYDNNGEPCIVTPWTIQEVFEAERSWCKPIPLTEEWLIKLGFEHYNQLGYNIKNNNFEIDIWFDDNGTINDIQLSSTNISGAYPNIKNFQYLHQIQNLYFTLTGEELKLK